jgi:hypothetical protein
MMMGSKNGDGLKERGRMPAATSSDKRERPVLDASPPKLDVWWVDEPQEFVTPRTAAYQSLLIGKGFGDYDGQTFYMAIRTRR